MAALPALAHRTGVRVPDYDPAGLPVRIVHLGVGAFHRAHQAVFTEDSGDPWGICGFTQRSDSAVRALAPQDGLYSVLEGGQARVVGTLREVRSAAHDPDGVGARIADPRITVVTLTVTEKGYHAAGGHLDLTDELVRSDLAGFGVPGHRARSAVGQLVDGLELRRRHDAGPLSVLPCDNITENGAVLRRLVGDFCQALPGDGPLAWIEANAAFPSTMVDRIVPAAEPADRAAAQHLLGCADAATVIAEPFKQWVIEDCFAAPHPDWQVAGALMTGDVRPYEAMKLRLFNATHSLIAYLGQLGGHETIAAALTDPGIEQAARALMASDAAPTLTPPAGTDLAAYQDSVLARCADPALRHRTAQVAADGSVKLPVRLLGTVRDRLAAGAEPYWAALAVAAWMVYVARSCDGQARGGSAPLQDPHRDALARAIAGQTDAPAIVDGLLALRAVFPEDLAGDLGFRRLLVEHAARLMEV